MNQMNLSESTINEVDKSSRKILFCPSLMIIGIEQIMEKYNSNSNNDQLKELYIKRSPIKYELFNKSLDMKCKRDKNTKSVKDVVNSFNMIPSLLLFWRSNLTIPEFDEILVEPADTAEIKEFINKVNFEMIGCHCNHKVMNGQCD